MKKLLLPIPVCFLSVILPLIATAQVDSGSDGSDGAFNPTQSVEIDMADHPDGIYQFTSVNIPSDVIVTFKPNANNKPVVWLVQNDCVIAGVVDLSGKSGGFNAGGEGLSGGAGGYRGGNGGPSPGGGLGPGGGMSRPYPYHGGNASHASAGQSNSPEDVPGAIYGNKFILPLIGGSGGGGSGAGAGGGGGGGALLIAASGTVQISGVIQSYGGAPGGVTCGLNCGIYGGGGSGGAVRIVGTRVIGAGSIAVPGGYRHPTAAGSGWVRLDAWEDNFGGTVHGTFTRGFQPIIIPAPGQGMQLRIQSVAGNSVPSNPSGVLANPDVIVPAQQSNPIPIVVQCTNVPLNSEVTVIVHPVNGSDVKAVGVNNAGTKSSSTAVVSLNLPRGGGIIYASVVTGINGGGGTASAKSKKAESYAKTGLTANGERFAKMETKVQFGGKQRVAYITKSGKRYEFPN